MSVMTWSQDLKKKKNKLSWIIHFLQMDLGNLSQSEKRHLTLSPMLIPLYGGSIVKVLHSRRGQPVPMDKLLPPEGLKCLQDGMNKFFHSLLDQKESGFPVRLPSTERELTISNAGSYEIEYPTYVSTQTIADVSIFISEFADLLKGLPKDCIRKCPGCERFFAHISRKKKLYCSNRCAYKAVYHKRIEKLLENGQYEVYLNRQSKIMKKRYREKILNGKED